MPDWSIKIVQSSSGDGAEFLAAELRLATLEEVAERCGDAGRGHDRFAVRPIDGRISMKTLSPVEFGFVCVPWKWM